MKKLVSSGYLAVNPESFESEDIKNQVIRFGIEKFSLSISQANESLPFLARLFLLRRGKEEILVTKDNVVSTIAEFIPKKNKYLDLSYRINCSFMFEYNYDGIIENAPCVISLRGLDKKQYPVYLSTSNDDYTDSVEGHLLVFSNISMHSLLDNIKPLIEFDIFVGGSKIGWGYFQSGIMKTISGIK